MVNWCWCRRLRRGTKLLGHKEYKEQSEYIFVFYFFSSDDIFPPRKHAFGQPAIISFVYSYSCTGESMWKN